MTNRRVQYLNIPKAKILTRFGCASNFNNGPPVKY